MGGAQGALVVIAVIVGFWGIAAARTFLIPLVLASFAFLLVSALDRVWGHLRIGGRSVPKPLATVLSALFITALGLEMVQLISANAAGVARAAPAYNDRFNELQDNFVDWITFAESDEEGDSTAVPGDEEPPMEAGLPEETDLAEEVDLAAETDLPEEANPAEETEPPESTDILDRLIDQLNFTGMATGIASGLAGLVGNGALVLIYLFFLLLERPLFDRKLRAMVPDDNRRQEVTSILERIDHDVSAYLGLKTLISLMTAIPSYVILRWVGVDFAEFWAIVIFVLNFIPNVGSLIATVLPATIALVQFPDAGPFWRVAIGVTLIQAFVGNVVEPKILGRRLNMSPLVVIVALVGWSLLWGVPGAFLCVPMTNIILLILANLRSTRWIAVMLSNGGELTEFD